MITLKRCAAAFTLAAAAVAQAAAPAPTASDGVAGFDPATMCTKPGAVASIRGQQPALNAAGVAFKGRVRTAALEAESAFRAAFAIGVAGARAAIAEHGVADGNTTRPQLEALLQAGAWKNALARQLDALGTERQSLACEGAAAQ